MKTHCIFHLVLAVLEGGLSGAVLYQAGQAGEKKRKLLLFAASAAWFVLSLMDSLQGVRSLRELLAQKKENGGEYDE